MKEALITGEVLRWARERRGLGYSQLARRSDVQVECLRKWEEGSSHPPFGKAQELAGILKIPFGMLFLPSRPLDSYPIPDFRTVDSKASDTLGPDLAEVINQATTKQEWYREYCEENSEDRLSIVGSFKISSGVNAVARDISSKLHINEELRRSCSSSREYLSKLSDAAQEIGILVMRSGVVGNDPTRSLNVQEFRGFTLTDPFAPVVFINSRDSYSAQVFTLAHELTHIWIGQSGISNPDPSETPANRLEVFCDAVAAETLAPTEEFESAWAALRDHSDFPTTLARKFWVSPMVAIRRAHELHKITDDDFFRLVKVEKQKTFTARKGKGGNPNRTLLSRNGKKLTHAILNALRENRLVYRDAALLLGVSLSRVPNLLRKSLA